MVSFCSLPLEWISSWFLWKYLLYIFGKFILNMRAVQMIGCWIILCKLTFKLSALVWDKMTLWTWSSYNNVGKTVQPVVIQYLHRSYICIDIYEIVILFSFMFMEIRIEWRRHFPWAVWFMLLELPLSTWKYWQAK